MENAATSAAEAASTLRRLWHG